MNAMKVGWAGQTYALAKCNDSGESKKSRIRRSKEERKAMAESFIKKYQTLNNGSFPSLNLTHKEVGGSFYTVREIVREIIQENRVLGPAKFPSENQTSDEFLEQCANETHSVPSHHQDTSEELVLNLAGPMLENGHIVNGFQESKKPEEFDQLEELVVSAEKLTDVTAEVIVEIFPVRSINKATYGEGSGEARDSTGVLLENETEKVGPEPGNTSTLLERAYSGELLDLVAEKAATDVANASLENSECFKIEEGIMGNDQNATGGEVKVSRKDILVLETTKQGELTSAESEHLKNSSNDPHAKNLNGSNTSNTCGNFSSKDAIEIDTKAEVQPDSSKKGSNLTLDRINLESWEGSSKKPETNPVLAVFKSFLAAFIKFWSE